MVVCARWPVDETCLPEDWPDDPDVVDRLVDMASQILWAASGRTVGTCRYTVRPCRADRGDLCQGVCGCAPVCSVHIGEGQVTAVEQILLHGEPVPETAWRLYAGGRLVLDHDWCFPACQDLSLPATEPGTWEITYLEGTPPSPLAARAVTALVAELARQCAAGCGTSSRRLTAWQVEGASYSVDPETAAVPGGAFAAIPAVDDWLSTVNPYGGRRQAAVFGGRRRHYRHVER